MKTNKFNYLSGIFMIWALFIGASQAVPFYRGDMAKCRILRADIERKRSIGALPPAAWHSDDIVWFRHTEDGSKDGIFETSFGNVPAINMNLPTRHDDSPNKIGNIKFDDDGMLLEIHGTRYYKDNGVIKSNPFFIIYHPDQDVWTINGSLNFSSQVLWVNSLEVHCDIIKAESKDTPKERSMDSKEQPGAT